MDTETFDNTFSIILSSDDSLEYHKGNNASNFTVQFDKHILLQRPMEVALAEIIYTPKIKAKIITTTTTTMTTTMTTKIDKDPRFKLKNAQFILRPYKGDDPYKAGSYLDKHKIILAERIYQNEEEFYNHIVEVFNKNVDETLDVVVYAKDKWNMTFPYFRASSETMNIQGNKLYHYPGNALSTGGYEEFFKWAWIIFPKNICQIELGAEESHPGSGGDTAWKIKPLIFTLREEKKIKFPDIVTEIPIEIPIETTTQTTIESDLANFYVHTDIVKPSYVGSSKRNVLRIVPFIRDDKVKTKHQYFNNLHFNPLNKTEIPHITIAITDMEYKNIDFSEGKTIVTLIFRPLEHS